MTRISVVFRLIFAVTAVSATGVMAAAAAAGSGSAHGVSLRDTSLFLSGRAEYRGRGPLSRVTALTGYRTYRERLTRYWTAYKTNEAEPISRWRKSWLPEESLETCFYPFSGADFLNAWLFYPRAKLFVMVGLEKAGSVPDLGQMENATVEQGMNMLAHGMRYLMVRNFYRTIDMMKDLDGSPFTGTIPHILCQMGWLGLKPLAVYRVDLEKGRLCFSPLKAGESYPRIAVEFDAGDGVLRKVVYLSMNLRDSELGRHPGWKRYLASLGPADGILKAASCLMHKSSFTNIRSICLGTMRTIVQDDSCIPYKYFVRGWDVSLFGDYTGPIRLFKFFSQSDLAGAYRKAEKRPFSFHYSYNPDDGSRNLMLMRRKTPAGPGPSAVP